MKKFEYKMFTVQKMDTFNKVNSVLNEYGKEGWELVQMFDRDSWYVCIIKKESKGEVENENTQKLND